MHYSPSQQLEKTEIPQSYGSISDAAPGWDAIDGRLREFEPVHDDHFRCVRSDSSTCVGRRRRTSGKPSAEL